MIRVHSIETFGTNDGPGIRLVVFVQGCNFRCLYCQNPDTQAKEGGTLMSPKELMARIEKQRPYFGESGGLTISGGEPTLQAEELIPLFKLAKKAGVHTALDTNGGAWNPEIEKLYALTDLVILDVKHIDDETHKRLTGASNQKVLERAAYCEANKKKMWIRYVLVPGWNDSEDVARRFGEHFKNCKMIERLEILPYHTLGVYKYKELGRTYELEGLAPLDRESVMRVHDILQEYFPNIVIH